MKTRWNWATVAALFGVVAGCAVGTAQSPPQPSPRAPRAEQPGRTASVDPAQAERLRKVMLPLIQNMNRPLSPGEVKIGIMDDSHINAANAGGGEFYVTTGLLQKSTDDQLRGVMGHEVAHADLGHVAKTQALGAGVNIGMIILDQIVPGSGALTPLAGQLIVNAYTRKEEYEADAHGAEILRRSGHDGKKLMVDTLTWLQQSEGGSGGGFFATHPATGDRIEAVQKLR